MLDDAGIIINATPDRDIPPEQGLKPSGDRMLLAACALSRSVPTEQGLKHFHGRQSEIELFDSEGHSTITRIGLEPIRGRNRRWDYCVWRRIGGTIARRHRFGIRWIRGCPAE